MKIEIKNPELFRSIIVLIDKSAQSIILEAHQSKGIYISASAIGLIWKIEAAIKSSEIIYHEISKEVIYSINLAKLQDFFKRSVDNYDGLIIELDESNKLSFEVYQLSNQIRRRFSTSILNIENETKFDNIMKIEKKMDIILFNFEYSLLTEIIRSVSGPELLIEYSTDQSISFNSGDNTNSTSVSINLNGKTDCENGMFLKPINSSDQSFYLVINSDYFKFLKNYDKSKDISLSLALGERKPLLGVLILPEKAGYIAIAIAPIDR
jgi:hypothetical protein